MKNEPPSSPPARPIGIAGRLWKASMGVILIIVASVFVSYLWGTYERAAEMDTWAEVPTVIESLEADDSQLNQRGMVKHVLEVRYPYEFEGKSYMGTRIKRLPVEASDPRKLKKYIETYREGNATTCYVDPENPSFAVLKIDSKGGLYSIWFPCLFVVGGAGLVLSALFGRSTPRKR